MGKLHIDTLGTNFTIQANEDDEYLKKILTYYNRITDDIKKIDSVKDPLQIAILSGIMIVDELYKEKQKKLKNQNDMPITDNSELSDEVSKRTLKMIEKINKVL